MLLVFLFGFVQVSGQQNYEYSEVVEKSLLFYEGQRSGHLTADHRVTYQQDSATEDQVVGGWYDAGDHIKFGLPMASATTLLTWGALTFADGYAAARSKVASREDVATKNVRWVKDSVKWPLDYFLAGHTMGATPDETEFVAQIGSKRTDHVDANWVQSKDITGTRNAYVVNADEPGSDVAGATAAAMAAGAILFADDAAYSEQLMSHARNLYEFAKAHRGSYSDTTWGKVHDILSCCYKSWSGYKDELGLAATWLYKATGEAGFLSDAKQFVTTSTQHELSWDDGAIVAQILLVELGETKYVSAVDEFFWRWTPCGGIDTTPGGLAWNSQWGSLRYAANAAFAAFQYATILRKGEVTSRFTPEYLVDWGKRQIDYMLGNNPNDISYVVGFGKNPPCKAHHGSGSCPDGCGCSYSLGKDSGKCNPHGPVGALVGGPGSNDEYSDDRNDYIANEVAIDYNSGFQGALAFLIQEEELSSPSWLEGVSPCGVTTDCPEDTRAVTTCDAKANGGTMREFEGWSGRTYDKEADACQSMDESTSEKADDNDSSGSTSAVNNPDGYCTWKPSCSGSVEGGDWCNASEERCTSCGGAAHWCAREDANDDKEEPKQEVDESNKQEDDKETEQQEDGQESPEQEDDKKLECSTMDGKFRACKERAGCKWKAKKCVAVGGTGDTPEQEEDVCLDNPYDNKSKKQLLKLRKKLEKQTNSKLRKKKLTQAQKLYDDLQGELEAQKAVLDALKEKDGEIREGLSNVGAAISGRCWD